MGLEVSLQRVTSVACELAGAQCAALGIAKARTVHRPVRDRIRRCRSAGTRAGIPAVSPPHAPEDTNSGTICSSQVVRAVGLLHEQGVKEVLLLSQDRDGMARNLHDRVIQRIFAAGLSLQNLRHVISDEASLKRVTAITDEMDASIRELRETIYCLRLPDETREPLDQRIMRAVVSLSADAIFEPHIHLTGLLDDNVPEATAEHLLAVVTEALSNIVRHAKATSVSIKIDVDPAQVTFLISDDGAGFASPSQHSG